MKIFFSAKLPTSTARGLIFLIFLRETCFCPQEMHVAVLLWLVVYIRGFFNIDTDSFIWLAYFFFSWVEGIDHFLDENDSFLLFQNTHFYLHREAK